MCSAPGQLDAYGLEAVTTAPTAPTTPAAGWPTPSVVLGIVAVGAAALREVHSLLLHRLGPLGHPGGLRLLGRPAADAGAASAGSASAWVCDSGTSAAPSGVAA